MPETFDLYYNCIKLPYFIFIIESFDDLYICIDLFPGGHSGNQSKSGSNSPQRYTLARFSDHLSQFILTKSPEASSGKFICCVLYKTSLKSSR